LYEKNTIFLRLRLPHPSGWRGATVLPCQQEWRGKLFHKEIIVHHGRSCRADACGAAACFGRVRDLGVAKQVRFGNKKKATVLILKIVWKKVKN